MSRVIIEITPSCIIEHSSGKSDNGPWERHVQKGYAHIGADFPLPITLSFRKETDGDLAVNGYPTGFYDIAASSFQLDRTGKFALNPYGLKLEKTNDRPGRPQPQVGGDNKAA